MPRACPVVLHALSLSDWDATGLSRGSSRFASKWSIQQITVGLGLRKQAQPVEVGVHGVEALAASRLAKRCRRSNRSYLVNFQSNGFGCLFVSSSYSLIRNSNSCKFTESFGVRTFLCSSEKYTSTWLSQLACTGVCTKMALGYALLILFTEAWPRCDEPLSTTQNTRLYTSLRPSCKRYS